MVRVLNDHVIDGQDSIWHEDPSWRGPVGAGVKNSLEAFQDGWQRPSSMPINIPLYGDLASIQKENQ